MIEIDTSSFIPFYEQIKQQFKSRISLGIVKPGEPLPSIRELATLLIINPNTVARAYRELEREGFIYTRKGKGCFVTDDSKALIKKERTAILNQVFDEAIGEAKKLNLSPNEIKKIFERRLVLKTEDRKKGERK